MTAPELSFLLQIPIVGIFVYFVLKYSEAQRKNATEQTKIFAETIDAIVKRLADESTARDETMRNYISAQREQDRGILLQTNEVMKFFREELQSNNAAMQNIAAAVEKIKFPAKKKTGKR